MKTPTAHAYADNELTIRVPRELQQHAQHVAMEQGDTLSELVCLALSSYITAYSAQNHPASPPMSLEDARQRMQILGQGLGEGTQLHIMPHASTTLTSTGHKGYDAEDICGYMGMVCVG